MASISRPLAPGIASATLICGVMLAAGPAADSTDVSAAPQTTTGGQGVAAHEPLLELGGAIPADPRADRDGRTDRSAGRKDLDKQDSDKKDSDKKDSDKDSDKKKSKKKGVDDYAPKSKGSGSASLDVTVQSPPKSRNNGGSSGRSNDNSDQGSSNGGSGGGTSGSTQACPSGSSVEQGLTANAVKVHRDVCHRWPQLTNYGGVRPDSMPEHPSGRALDIMISSNATGWEVARYLRANAGRLGISQVIFDQKIWTVQRSGEGWRWMSDRGGATANHRDHVHVTVYG